MKGTPTTQVLDAPRQSFFHRRALWAVWWGITCSSFRARYKRTKIGLGWIVLQPLLQVGLFSLIFGTFIRAPSAGVNYPLFATVSVLGWQIFQKPLNRAPNELSGQITMVKNYTFPRIVLPLASFVTFIVEVPVLLLIVGLALVLNASEVPAQIVLAPLFLLILLAFAFGLTLWLCILTVEWRDLVHALPFLLQILLFASPVAYSEDVVPEAWRWLWNLNPLVAQLQGLRWSILGTPPPTLATLSISLGLTALCLGSGVILFQRLEGLLADRL